MKKGLVLIVTLLAISSIMAAMAFTTATVTNDSQIKVTTTNKALLAIAAAGTDDDRIVQIKDGEATFNLGIGRNDTMYGFQPDSVYHYDYFMHVMNNSANPVKARIRLEGFGEYAEFINIKGAPGNDLVVDGDTVGSMLIDANRDHWNLSLTIKVPSSEVLKARGVNLSDNPFAGGKVIIEAQRFEGVDSGYKAVGW